MTEEQICAVFVYGTLKRGQGRERCWPVAPLEIVKAWTLGELYDTGPYPALFPGADCVAGEVWRFPCDQVGAVLLELDEVEEYRPGHEATSLYNRRIVYCTEQSAGTLHRAYTYFYNRTDEKRFFQRVRADYSQGDRSFAVWPVGGAW